MKIPGTFKIGEFHRKDPDDYQHSEYNPFGMESETWPLHFCVHERLSRKRKIFKVQKSYGRTPEEACRALGKATGIKWVAVTEWEFLVMERLIRMRKMKRRKARMKSKMKK